MCVKLFQVSSFTEHVRPQRHSRHRAPSLEGILFIVHENAHQCHEKRADSHQNIMLCNAKMKLWIDRFDNFWNLGFVVVENEGVVPTRWTPRVGRRCRILQDIHSSCRWQKGPKFLQTGALCHTPDPYARRLEA